MKKVMLVVPFHSARLSGSSIISLFCGTVTFCVGFKSDAVEKSKSSRFRCSFSVCGHDESAPERKSIECSFAEPAKLRDTAVSDLNTYHGKSYLRYVYKKLFIGVACQVGLVIETMCPGFLNDGLTRA